MLLIWLYGRIGATANMIMIKERHTIVNRAQSYNMLQVI
jgi:hypothetical protein